MVRPTNGRRFLKVPSRIRKLNVGLILGRKRRVRVLVRDRWIIRATELARANIQGEYGFDRTCSPVTGRPHTWISVRPTDSGSCTPQGNRAERANERELLVA